MFFCHMHSPVGPLLLAGDRQGLRHIGFPEEKRPVRPQPDWVKLPAFFTSARAELAEYFAGRRKHFTLPLAPRGTPFQLAVWRELERVPYGTTVSYGELARRVGRPGAARAVGGASGANPLPIVIPCHRVIGADGGLTGFGGGLTVKEFLLALEGAC